MLLFILFSEIFVKSNFEFTIIIIPEMFNSDHGCAPTSAIFPLGILEFRFGRRWPRHFTLLRFLASPGARLIFNRIQSTF